MRRINNNLLILLCINRNYFNQSGSSSSVVEMTGHSDTTGTGFFFFCFDEIISSSFASFSEETDFLDNFLEGVFVSDFISSSVEIIAFSFFLVTFLEVSSVSIATETGPLSQSGMSSYGTASFSHSVVVIITGSSGIISCFGVSRIISSVGITGASDAAHLSQSGISSSSAISVVFLGSVISSTTSCFKDSSSIPFIHGGKSDMVSSEMTSGSITGIFSSRVS